MESNPLAGLVGLLMMLQLGIVLLLLLGGLYALYCLNRAASGLDRMASAVENWVAQNAKLQAQQAAQNQPLVPPLPGQNPLSVPPTPPTPPTPAPNPDWIRPIELTNAAPSSNPSNQPNQAALSQPEVVQSKPPYIPPVTPPFGSEFGPEAEETASENKEVKRD